MVKWVKDDGGRSAAGYKGQTRDCVCRAIAIATQKPYKEIYKLIIDLAKKEKRYHQSHPRTGVYKETVRAVMAHLGWIWVPTMRVGQGCRVHLKSEELPKGRLVVVCSRHEVAVIDGVIHDISDPSRNGTRCVYGYYFQE